MFYYDTVLVGHIVVVSLLRYHDQQNKLIVCHYWVQMYEQERF